MIIRDQQVEIADILIDGTKMPVWFTHDQSYVEFDNLKYKNSTLLSHNGVWVLNFEAPFITFFLDKKINKEAVDNQDYKYPWSYKLGPDSVDTLSKEFAAVKELIKKHL